MANELLMTNRTICRYMLTDWLTTQPTAHYPLPAIADCAYIAKLRPRLRHTLNEEAPIAADCQKLMSVPTAHDKKLKKVVHFLAKF